MAIRFVMDLSIALVRTMRKTLILTAVAAIGLTTPAWAEDAAGPKPALMLSAAEIDPARLLPPQPAEGSPAARAELAELHAIEAARTPDLLAHAASDDVTKDASIFAAAMGPGFDLSRLPATARLMGEVRREEKAAADKAKAFFQRKRPVAVRVEALPRTVRGTMRDACVIGHAGCVRRASED